MKTTEKTHLSKRDIGVDLLRILLALMVVSIHFNAPMTGKVAVAVSESPFNYLVGIVMAICIPAVDTYVIISGYYSYKLKKSYKGVLNSLFKLWFCLLFFSVMGYVAIVVIEHKNFSFFDFILRFFPLSRGTWWFMSNYTVMMLISPMLNIVIGSYTYRQNIIIIVVSLLICSVIPFFLKWHDVIGLNNGYGVLWFVVLYYTGAILNVYEIKTKYHGYFRYLLLFVFLAILLIVLDYLLNNDQFISGYPIKMYNSLVVYFQAVTLFLSCKHLCFRNFRINKVIVFFSGLSLAVYIFHCQEDIGSFLWETLKPSKYANSWNIVPLFITTIIGVFSVSILIEYFREKFFYHFEDINCKRLTNLFVRFFEKDK